MKSMMLLLATLSALSLPAGADAGGASTGAELKVVTLNLYHDKDDWPRRRVQIAEQMKTLQPDVIALQEVIQHQTLSNQAQWLADQLGYRWHFVSTDDLGKPQRYGNALLTRRPILKRGQKPLQPLDDNRTVAFLRIDLDGRTLNLYATHLHWTDDGAAIRARQVENLMGFIAETSEGLPSLLLGDFNATADAPELTLVRKEFVDVYGSQHADADTPSGSTLNLKYFAPKRIDHIFHQAAAFEPVESKILFDRADAQGTWASDHFGLYTKLRLSPVDSAVKQPWLDPRLSPDARANVLLAAMTLDEKFRYLHADFGDTGGNWVKPEGAMGSAAYIPANTRLGLPAIHETDAGQGVTRAGASGTGATSLPAMLAVAASWDTRIAYDGGAMIGRQAWRKGFNVLLAGSVNLQRDPRNGRNFEYAGEDPLLAGTIVGHAIRGVQDQHVVSTMKHYALNDLETERNTHSANLGEAAMRESDLLAFQFANEIGEPGSVMCAYNKVNGIYACEHDWLLNQVLKKEWGFKGWVMSDWGGVHSAGKAALAGLDQQSAGEVFDKEVYFDKPLRAALAAGEVPQARIDDMVQRILRSMIAHGWLDHPATATPIDYDADGLVARHAAEAGAVLLRNERAALPLSKRIASIAVIGGHADIGVLSGGGSSAVQPPGGNAMPPQTDDGWPGPRLYQPSSPLKELQALAPQTRIEFADGTDLAAAAALAARSEVVVVFASQWAAESFDQPGMTLEFNQDALVAAVAAANPRTVVVLQTNGPVRLPWLQQVDAVLQAWYPGARGGEAIARLLFGEVDPSGRLPVTWPRNESQLPRPAIAGSGQGNKSPPSQEIDYNIEGANAGYKWFAARGMKPLFPFGHGLTYTRFHYDKLATLMEGSRLLVSFDVRNTGERAGTDVPQVYLQLPSSSATPIRLLGWQRLALAPGQSQRVSLEVDPRLLAHYDTGQQQWRIEAGSYGIRVAGSAIDPGVSTEVQLEAAVLHS